MPHALIFRIFVASLLVGLCLGIFIEVAWQSAIFLALSVAIIFLVVFPGRIGIIGALACAFVVFGTVRSGNVANFWKNLPAPNVVSGKAEVRALQEEKGFYRATTLRFRACASEFCPETKVLWQAPRDALFMPGDLVALRCNLAFPENFSPDFDYRGYLAKEGIGYLCKKENEWSVLPAEAKGRALATLFSVGKRFESGLGRALPEPQAGLAAGLLLGGDERLPKALIEDFRGSGLGHIVALSGFNLVIVTQAFLLFGIALGLRRKHSALVAWVGAFLLVALAGFPASAVRALVMASVLLAAALSGRLSSGWNGLYLAVAGMLFVNPLLLPYDLGFALSVLATAGLVGLAPLRERLLEKINVTAIRPLAETVLMTLSAEVAVMPWIFFMLGTVSPLALVANFFALPVVSLAMLFSFTGSLVALALPGLAILAGAPAWAALSWIIGVAEFFGSVTWTFATEGWWWTAIIACWYGFMIIGFLQSQPKPFYERVYAKK